MAFNLENMTIDYKKMLRMVPSDRTSLAQSGAISDLISSLTPGQLVNLFPRYYRDQLPDVGKAVSSLGGALSGGTNLSGGGGGGGSTYTPNTTNPPKSPSAEEKAVQELLQEAGIGTVELSGDSREKAADLTDRMVKDLGISETKAAAIVGNFMHESGDFQHMQEIAPVSGRGGYGWAQWTGPRRRNFEAFVAEKRLDINSDAANYQFFLHEIQNDPYEKQQFERWKNTEYGDLAAETVAFENSYERAGVKHHGSRIQRAETALQMYEQKIANIESEASNIKDLSIVQPQFDPNMVSQLDERLQKWYNNANDIQKKNFEEALGKLGVDKFNQTMERQPINNATIEAVSILKTSGDSILDPSLTRVSQDQDQLAGTRKLPLQQELVDTMNYAAQKISEETGRNIYFKTFSGGQAPLGSGGPRTGSTEHDLGGAADNYFIEVLPDGTEKMLSMSNPDDKSLMYKTAYHFARAGGRSVGLETGYMGNESIHFGISRNNEDPTHHADKELSAIVDQGKSEFLQEAKEKDWDPKYGYKDFYLQEKQKRQKEADAKLKTEAEAIAQSDPVTAAQNNMQQPPTEVPALPAAEIPAVAAPGLSIGGTVPMTPGENIAGVNTTTGKLEFMSNDRELYTKDDSGNLRVDPSTIRQEDQKAEVASAEPQRVETQNQPMQRKPEQPMPVSTPDPNFIDTMSSGSMASSPSQLRALNRAKLYGENSGNLVNGHFS